uniref:Uncharacterized protein n=1 Tax=Arundo donax TaxID=35708 RepID=A0A0A9TRP5_ARUDO
MGRGKFSTHWTSHHTCNRIGAFFLCQRCRDGQWSHAPVPLSHQLLQFSSSSFLFLFLHTIAIVACSSSIRAALFYSTEVMEGIELDSGPTMTAFDLDG